MNKYKEQENEWREYLKSMEYPGSPNSKHAKRIYWKDFRKRKRKLLKYIRKHYCEFGPDNILDINIILIDNLYDYHKKGLNIFAADEYHEQTLKTLELASTTIHELFDAVNEIENYNQDKVDQLKKTLFETISKYYNIWSD